MSWPKARLTLQRSQIARANGRNSGRLPATSLASRARPGITAIIAICASLPLLTACGGTGFRPLHAANGYGASVSEKMAAVDVAPIPGRVGQQIRNELIYQSTGGGEQARRLYRLEIAIRETVTSTLIQKTGESKSQVYNIDASFKLVSLADKKVVLEGKSYGRAGFERFESIFANVRARRDAEDRAATTVGTELKTRLEAYLAGTA